MADFGYNVKRGPFYTTGTKLGFFAGLFVFSSVFYFVFSKFGIIPKAVKYTHVLIFAAVVYAAWFIYKMFRK